MGNTEIVTATSQPPPPQALQQMEEMTVDQAVSQLQKVQAIMKATMKEGEHYGVIPGCGPKPTLLKPGAEKLALVFRLAPSFEITQTDIPVGHREYRVVCTLTHINTGRFLGSGLGCCSTMEGKYRYRHAERTCPKCGSLAIIKGKKEYGGGWICWKKEGGCGAKWGDGAQEIEGQMVDKVEHDNPADYYNTVLKMAKKRAQVDATLTATAASDCFTQDLEEMTPQTDAQAPEKNDNPPATRPAGAAVYTADPEISPFTVKAIRQANPAYGDFLMADQVRAMAADAKRMPAREAQYRNLVLNQRVDRVAPLSVWHTRPISEPQQRRLFAIARKSGWDDKSVKDLLEAMEYRSSRDIQRRHYDLICRCIEENRDPTKEELAKAGLLDAPKTARGNDEQKMSEEQKRVLQTLTQTPRCSFATKNKIQGAIKSGMTHAEAGQLIAAAQEEIAQHQG